VLDVDPSFVMAHWRLGEIYLHQGKVSEALPELASGGWNTELLKMLETHAVVASPGEHAAYSSYFLAQVAASIGARAEAIASLAIAVNVKRPEALLAGVDPIFEGLHTDPRFQGVLQRTGLRTNAP
jgi:hypothetical protein